MSLPPHDLLRMADPLLGLALVMLIGIVAADALYRAAGLPRAAGLMLIGMLASPFGLGFVERADLDPWRPLLDLAIGVLVFELGSRIQPRWLLHNPALAIACVLEGVAAGAAVWTVLSLLGAPALSAALAGAVAMASSPVISMAAVNELNPRGQVTERLLMANAVNSVLAMMALKIWSISAAGHGQGPSGEWLGVGADALYVIFGSLLLGAAAGTLLQGLARIIVSPANMPVLQFAIVILATLLAAQWHLSPLLALLAAAVLARRRMGHRLMVEPHFGSAGAVLGVLLFISLGLLITLDGAMQVWPWALAIIATRFAAKSLAVVATARFSGLGWRQAAALSIALQPMSGLAVLLASDNFGWPQRLAGVDAQALHAVLLAAALMQLVGPLLIQTALHRIAREAEPSRSRR